MRIPRRPSLPATLPMPLWLQAIVETVLMTVASLAVVLVLLLCGWASMGFPGGVEPVLGGAGQLWLAAHGVGLRLEIPGVGGQPGVSGLATFTPLGLTLLLLLFARRAGARLAHASYEGQFWQPVLSSALTYAVLGAGISLATSTDELSTHVVAAAIVPVWIVLAGAVWGGHRVSGSWLRLIGIRREGLIERYNQYTRWAGAYIACVLRAAWLGLLAVVAGGALLTGVAILYHWNDAIALQQGLHAGLLGDLVLALFQLAILPNLVIFGTAWGLGAGFSLGEGTLISPAVTDAAGLPALPVLGAVPAGTGPWSFAVLALPVLAGALAGWWFVRAGENHLDEWLALKIRYRWLSALLSGAALALAVGLLVGAGAAVLAALSRGSLGVGRFTEVGPDPLLTGLWALVTVGVGVLIGQLLSPVLERDGAPAAGGWAAKDPGDSRATSRPRRERRLSRRRERRALKGAKSPATEDRGPAPENEESERPGRSVPLEPAPVDATPADAASADGASTEAATAEAATAEGAAPAPVTGEAAHRSGETPGLTALERLRGARAGGLAPSTGSDQAQEARDDSPAEPWAATGNAPDRTSAREAHDVDAETGEGLPAHDPARPPHEDGGETGLAADASTDAAPAGGEEERPRGDVPAGMEPDAPAEEAGTAEGAEAAEEPSNDEEASASPAEPADEEPRPEPRRVVVARPRRRRPRG